MKCPMQKIRILEGTRVFGEFFQCIERECAWWHTYDDEKGITHEGCAIIHIADALRKS